MILVSVTTVLMGAAFYRLLASTEEFARHELDAKVVHQLVTDVTDLRFILMESVLYKEKRSQQLWKKKLANLRVSLQVHQYALPSENAYVNKIISVQNSIDIAYDRLAQIIYPVSSSISPQSQSESIARTTTSLFVLTQEMLDCAANISRINSDASVKKSERRKIVTFILLCLFVSIIIIFIFAILNKILKPIHDFQISTEIIAQGNLSHRVNIQSKDEIGVLSTMFDAMTAQLQYTVNNLKNEILEREVSQKKLAKYADQLKSDIVARTLAEKKLLDAQFETQLSESRLRHVMNSAFIGIVQGDSSDRLREVNDTFLELSGYSRADLLSGAVGWSDMISGDIFLLMENMHREFAQDEKIPPFERSLFCQDGRELPVMIGLSKMEGELHEWVAFIFDLTERHRIERIKSEFISVVSHELRTPLTSIRGSLGLLEGGVFGELPTSVVKLIKVANSNSLRLHYLINDILDMDKLISGNMPLNMQKIDLQAIAVQSIEANGGYAATLSVSYAFTKKLEAAYVLGDAQKLMQVFANFLSNAAKFSPQNDLVDIRIILRGDHYRVEVEDHGSGVSLEFRTRIFEAFAQANSGNTRQQGGTGLGLKISKTLIEGMNGTIGFDSEEGHGAIFWFTLPVAA